MRLELLSSYSRYTSPEKQGLSICCGASLPILQKGTFNSFPLPLKHTLTFEKSAYLKGMICAPHPITYGLLL